MHIQKNSIVKSLVDSKGVTHYQCNMVTNIRGLLRNVWVIECCGILSIMSTLDGRSFDHSLNEYLTKHDLSIVS